jgi:hypothetical protein
MSVFQIICCAIVIIYPLCILPLYIQLHNSGYQESFLKLYIILIRRLVIDMPSDLVLKLEKMQHEIPYMTQKSDMLNHEADLLDRQADKEVNELKKCKLRTQAANKRLQANRIISDVEIKSKKLKDYGIILKKD